MHTCWELGPAHVAARGVVERLKNGSERNLAAIVPAHAQNSDNTGQALRALPTHAQVFVFGNLVHCDPHERRACITTVYNADVG